MEMETYLSEIERYGIEQVKALTPKNDREIIQILLAQNKHMAEKIDHYEKALDAIASGMLTHDEAIDQAQYTLGHESLRKI